MNKLQYKGYYGSIEYSEYDKCLYGEVLGLDDNLIMYEGNTSEELLADFKDAIEFYLESCEERGVSPEKPQNCVDFSLPVSVFEKLNALATKAGLSLNAYLPENVENPVAV